MNMQVGYVYLLPHDDHSSKFVETVCCYLTTRDIGKADVRHVYGLSSNI
jgi:hypothetical protein